MNELVVVLITCTLPVFTDIIDSNSYIPYKLSWGILALVMLQCLFNFIFQVISLQRQVRKVLRKWLNKRKIIRKMKKFAKVHDA